MALIKAMAGKNFLKKIKSEQGLKQTLKFLAVFGLTTGILYITSFVYLLPDFDQSFDEIKKLNLAVMIETNGTYPEKIKMLLDTERLNYIAMDIKASFGNSGKKYKEAVGGDVDIDNIKRSMDIIMSSDIDYEFRTTVVPGIIDTEDIIGIATTIEGAKRLCLQQFSPKDTLDPAYLKVKPYPREILEEMAEAARKFVKVVMIKNV